MKRFFSFLAAATMLFAVSCAEDTVGTDNGNEAQVTFNLGLEGQSATRAIGEGKTVTHMYYQVFDANGNKLALTTEPVRKQEFSETDRTATISLQLAKGQEYTLVVWAQYEDNNYKPYTVADGMVVTANYEGVVSNAENRDAFCAVHKFTPGDGRTDVTLYRPFAQLNVGVTENDWNAAGNSNVNITKSEVVISKVYTTFDVRQNIFGGEVADVTFAMNARPGQNLDVELNGQDGIQADEQFHYLSMNYLMIGEKMDIGAKFCFATEDGKHVDFELATIPTERNHRTNIVGQILTGTLDFNVKIDESFDGDVATLDNFVSTALDLQAALDAAPVGQTTVIRLGADIKGDVIEFQKADRHIVIEGNGRKYDGTIKIHNGSNYNNGSITIEGVNFETETKGVNFIHAVDFGVENGVSRRYSNNITVKNCSFTATGEAVNTAVGVQVNATRNLQIIKCTATNMHSLVQAQSCGTDVIVKDCEITGKNGVAFKQVKSAVVEGTTINAVAYGIRFDGNIDNYGITVNNNTVTAAQPFIVRKMTGQNNTITLEGTNTLTVSAASISTEAPAYQIVITNGSDDEAYVKPTGTYTLTGADNFVVYPRDVYFFVATWDEFTAALAANEPKIKLTDNIEYDANYQLQKDVVIDLNGKSMTLPMINIHKNVTIKNGTINGKVYARKNSEIVFNKVTFSGAVSDNLSTEGHLAIQGGCKSLYAKDCLFSPTSVSGSQTKPLSFEGGSTIMKFENCEFKSSPYKKQVYFNSLSATGSLDFTNCNFNNKTPNIMFAAACPLTNLTMSGTTKLSSVTLETNRAKDAVTAEDLAYLRGSLIANNSMSSVRLFYAGGSSEYIR